MQRNVPPTLTPMMRLNSAGVKCSSRKFEKTPALLTSTSSRPKLDTAALDEPVHVVPRPRRRPRATATGRPSAASRSRARLRGGRARAVGEHDGRARLGEPPRAREAEALRGAGDERHLPAQVEQCGQLRFRYVQRHGRNVIRSSERMNRERSWRHC